MDFETFQEIQRYADDRIRDVATRERASIIAKVVQVNPGQIYHMQGTDQDGIYENISNSVPRAKWKKDQWLTMEWSGVDWTITGIAPQSGE